MIRYTHCFATIAAAVLMSMPALAARAQDAPPGDITNGKDIYIAVGCYTCHGRAGQGGAFTGPAPALAKTALPYAAFKLQLRTPARVMPAYTEAVMSEQAVADIYAFVQSLPGRRDAKSISILNN
jgi:mono/diheme cytochrome c family protein